MKKIEYKSGIRGEWKIFFRECSVILVSACLLGKKCTFKGDHNLRPQLKRLGSIMKIKAVCPEQMGGLATPRPPSEIVQGSGEDVLNKKAYVINIENQDVTEEFILGAQKTLETALKNDVKLAVFKARSPSCGCGEIYDGTHSGRLISANGVTTALLKSRNIRVLTDENWLDKFGGFME